MVFLATLLCSWGSSSPGLFDAEVAGASVGAWGWGSVFKPLWHVEASLCVWLPLSKGGACFWQPPARVIVLGDWHKNNPQRGKVFWSAVLYLGNPQTLVSEKLKKQSIQKSSKHLSGYFWNPSGDFRELKQKHLSGCSWEL